MSNFAWRWCAAIFISVSVIYLIFFSGGERSWFPATAPPIAWQAPTRPSTSLGQSNQDSAPVSSNSANADLDATNFALDQEQCHAHFPELYYEIGRAVRHWKHRNHTITVENIDLSWRDDAIFRILIHDNELRVVETKGSFGQYQDRVWAVVHQLHRALEGAKAAGQVLPTVEFSVTVDDKAVLGWPAGELRTTWTFTRRLDDETQAQLWLMPDFNFWSAPIAGGTLEYEETRELAVKHDSFMIDKIPKVVWRGARWTNPDVRGPLLDSTVNKSWADVQEVDWEKKTNLLAMEDMCDYMFLAHTEGRSWSGRLKYILSCDSLPIVHDLEWTTHYYHLLKPDGPDQNFVPMSRDWADLEKAIDFYIAHPTEAQRVADNSVATFRAKYITPAASACYWRKMIGAWSTVAFKPDPYEADPASGEPVLRGVGFEEFIELKSDFPIG